MKYTAFLALAAAITAASAKPIQPEFSHSIPEVLSEGEPIQNWRLQGSTKVFSDRLTLTDLGKSNQRGSAWSTVPNNYEKWTLDVDFSVAGPIHPGGGMAIWYTTQPGSSLGPVHGGNDKWDGLGVFIDSAAPSQDEDQGTIRGYLNDGSLNYKSESKPEDKAFAMCHLGYRNQGYKTQVKISYQQGFFRIKVNDQLCFQTDHISLPQGGYFGLSAENTENADSFILHRVQLYSDIVPKIDELVPDLEQKLQKQADDLNAKQQQQQQQAVQQQQPILKERSNGEEKALEAILERLNLLSTQPGSAQAATPNGDVEKLKADLRTLHDTQAAHQQSLEKKLNSLESVIQDLISLQRKQLDQGTAQSSSVQSQKARFESDMKKLHTRLEDINSAVKEHTASIVGSIPDTVTQAVTKGGPSIWMAFTLLIFIQGGVFVGYLVYKTRRASFHAKML